MIACAGRLGVLQKTETGESVRLEQRHQEEELWRVKVDRGHGVRASL